MPATSFSLFNWLTWTPPTCLRRQTYLHFMWLISTCTCMCTLTSKRQIEPPLDLGLLVGKNLYVSRKLSLYPHKWVRDMQHLTILEYSGVVCALLVQLHGATERLLRQLSFDGGFRAFRGQVLSLSAISRPVHLILIYSCLPNCRSVTMAICLQVCMALVQSPLLFFVVVVCILDVHVHVVSCITQWCLQNSDH